MLREILTEFNKELNKEIISNPDFKKAKAFGNAERFLLSPASAQLEPKKLTKWGLYPYEMDKGRGKTQNRTGGLWQGIYDWLSLKKYGIQWSNDKKRRGIAFAIVKKIGKEGSFKYRNPAAQTDIYGTALRATLPKLQKQILQYEAKNIIYAI